MSQVQPGDTLREWRESARDWAKHSATIRTMFAPLTRSLIEEASIIQGQSVLDVAGGSGEPPLTIAEIVGRTGSVTCTDAVTEMVGAATNKGQQRAMTDVRVAQCS